MLDQKYTAQGPLDDVEMLVYEGQHSYSIKHINKNVEILFNYCSFLMHSDARFNAFIMHLAFYLYSASLLHSA